MAVLQTDLTKRFIQLFEEGKRRALYKNAAQFCSVIDIKPQALNEVVKGRSNVGVQIIQNTVLKFPQMNCTWLFTGKGPMFYSDDEVRIFGGPAMSLIEAYGTIEQLKLELDRLKKLNDMSEQMIELQKDSIAMLKEKTRQQ